MTNDWQWRHTLRNGASVAHAYSLWDADEPSRRSHCGRGRLDHGSHPGDLKRLCRSCSESIEQLASVEVPWSEQLEASAAAALDGFEDRRRFASGDFPWPDGHVALVVNTGWSRRNHVFDLTVEATPEQPSICDLAEIDDVESYEVDGPSPTMCRRCYRLLAIAASITPPTPTMEDVRDERNAARARNHRAMLARLDNRW